MANCENYAVLNYEDEFSICNDPTQQFRMTFSTNRIKSHLVKQIRHRELHCEFDETIND